MSLITVGQKNEDDLAESWKFGTSARTLWYFFLWKNIFLNVIYIADMANWMCHFDNFDIDQIASKLAQRWNFVHSFYCKKISVLDSFDNAKNAKRHLFFGHPIFMEKT